MNKLFKTYKKRRIKIKNKELSALIIMKCNFIIYSPNNIILLAIILI